MGTIELTKKQVWSNFRDNYLYYLDEEAPYMIGKTAALYQRLLNEQGFETTNELLEYVCERWSWLKKKYRLNGLPNLGIIYGFRQAFLGDMRNAGNGKEGRENSEVDKKELYFDS